ncbi:IS3 family transposase [Streptomyces lydicus]|uniref:IS3 family transposase n=1 Tax=Streptomyces lydicus TaxID=47763 RepID=UPI0037A64237
MTVHPFIEAEKVAGHNVKRACELLQVSRAAFYARRTGIPGPRAVRDAELTEQAVIDIASRRVVGWATADHLRTELVADALRAACHTRRPASPVIFHSDRGCQYTSHEFAILADELGIRLSVGRTGQCWDNALAESYFATLKNELTDSRPWPSRADARIAIFEWIESWYNLQRLHSSLGYRTPADYEAVLSA